MSRLLLLIAALAMTQAPAATIRPLYAGATIRDSLAGGGKATFSIDVPAGTAARIAVRQEGIDVVLTLRRAGNDLPVHGLDFVSGPDGEEVAYPAILDTAAAWTLTVAASLPRAARDTYTVVFELLPADDRARAIAAVWARHSQA